LNATVQFGPKFPHTYLFMAIKRCFRRKLPANVPLLGTVLVAAERGVTFKERGAELLPVREASGTKRPLRDEELLG
jgi:hypothetical protein